MKNTEAKSKLLDCLKEMVDAFSETSCACYIETDTDRNCDWCERKEDATRKAVEILSYAGQITPTPDPEPYHCTVCDDNGCTGWCFMDGIDEKQP